MNNIQGLIRRIEDLEAGRQTLQSSMGNLHAALTAHEHLLAHVVRQVPAVGQTLLQQLPAIEQDVLSSLQWSDEQVELIRSILQAYQKTP